MIEPLQDVPAGVLGFRASDRLERGDVAGAVAPPLRAAIERGAGLRILVEVVPGFVQSHPMAALAELKGAVDGELRDRAMLERAALVTDIGWLANAVAMFGFMAPGEVRVFPDAEGAGARAWVAG